MSTSRRRRLSEEESAERGVLAHMEHLRAFGESLAKAADTYMTEHKNSEATSDWRDDLQRNLAEANNEFHRSLARAARRVADIYFADFDKRVEVKAGARVDINNEPEPTPSTTPTSGKSGSKGTTST